MKRKVQSVTRMANQLTDVKPELVALVTHGANQTPFRTLKAAEVIADFSTKENQMANARKAEIQKAVFSNAQFDTPELVTEYLEAKGYTDFTVTKTATGFEVVAKDAAEFTGALKALTVDKGVTFYAGELADGAEGLGAIKGAAKVVIKVASGDGVVYTLKEAVKKYMDFCDNPYAPCGNYTPPQGTTIAEVLSDRFSTGSFPAYWDLSDAFQTALFNLVSGGQQDQINNLTSEFADAIKAILDALTGAGVDVTEKSAFKTVKAAAAGDYGAASDAKYADPGFQVDKKPRYPLAENGDLSEEKIRAAWNYINKPHNGDVYGPGELSKIKNKIIAAWKSKIDPDGPPAADSDTTKSTKENKMDKKTKAIDAPGSGNSPAGTGAGSLNAPGAAAGAVSFGGAGASPKGTGAGSVDTGSAPKPKYDAYSGKEIVPEDSTMSDEEAAEKAAKAPPAKFDHQTGKPLSPQYDEMTGKPLAAKYDPATGKPMGDSEGDEAAKAKAKPAEDEMDGGADDAEENADGTPKKKKTADKPGNEIADAIAQAVKSVVAPLTEALTQVSATVKETKEGLAALQSQVSKTGEKVSEMETSRQSRKSADTTGVVLGSRKAAVEETQKEETSKKSAHDERMLKNQLGIR